MGFATMWQNQEKYLLHYSNWRYRVLAVVLSVAFLVVAAPARRAGKTLEQYGGWLGAAACALLITMFVLLSWRILKMAFHELRAADIRPRERAIGIAGTVLGVAIGGSSLNAQVWAVLDALGVADSEHYLSSIHGSNVFFETMAVAALAAVPLVVSAAGLVAMDGISRSWRLLQPLRRELAEVVPLANPVDVSNPRGRKTILDLHLTNVAIRDSILQLRPHFLELDPVRVDECQRHFRSRINQRIYAEQALRLADARAAHMADDAFPAAAAPSVLDLVRSASLETETTEMVRISRWWDCATLAAEERRSGVRAAEEPECVRRRSLFGPRQWFWLPTPDPQGRTNFSYAKRN